MDRRLSAILAADVVGYAALMERDEQGTYQRLVAARTQIFEPAITRHNGRIFKLTGDGLLAEFSSVRDAVECAVLQQRTMAERNAVLPAEQRILVRIGINFGEVIIEGDDRYGEGVNIASRLEQIAEPGGIVVSGKVVRELGNKPGIPFEPLGAQKLKNIAEPVNAFWVRFDGAAPMTRRARDARMAKPLRWLAAGLMIAALAVGGWFALRPLPSVAHEPSLAVLPFVNMSGDPAQDFYGPGIAEDIITMLSSYPSLRVVSRTSSFVYDKPVKVQQVGKELKVNYVIEGSVRRAGNKVRVTAQLVNASTGVHVWADRFDEESSDVAALQDDVAKRVYDTLAGLKGEVRRQEEVDAWSKSAPSLGEYDYYLRGHQYFFQFTAEGNKKAGEIWREGLTKFPNSALLRAKMAFVHTLEVTSGRSADPWQETLAARKYATEAEAIEDKSRLTALLTKWAMCWVYYLHDGDYNRAASAADGVVQTIPYDVFTKADLAFLKIVAGDLDQAIAWLEDSVRRDATSPAWYYGNLGLAYYFADRPQDALTMYDKADLPYLGLLRAVAEVRADRLDDAKNTIAGYLKEFPGWTLAKEATFPSGKHPQFIEPLLTRYLNDLAKAGLPPG